jgi:hypothetical protein
VDFKLIRLLIQMHPEEREEFLISDSIFSFKATPVGFYVSVCYFGIFKK